MGLGLVAGMAASPLAEMLPARAAAGSDAATVCRNTVYTGDGGYFSQGFFFWEPNDTVTIEIHWCSSAGRINSKSVSYGTTIPSSEQPRLTEGAGFGRNDSELKVSVGGDYLTGVLNNVGTILLVGHVAANGEHHFRDLSEAQG